LADRPVLEIANEPGRSATQTRASLSKCRIGRVEGDIDTRFGCAGIDDARAVVHAAELTPNNRGHIMSPMSSLSRKGLLGELEQLVMLALLRLDNEGHAPAVADEIEARASIALARGSVYVALDRLERKGYLVSRFGDPTAERGGKAKRLFAVTAEGRRALAAAERAISRLRVPSTPGRA
jgi:PadR family transcriptional regulator, regulatory protein PadR